MSPATAEPSRSNHPRGPGAARSLPDRLLGLLGGALIAAAMVVFLLGGEGDGEQPPAPAPAPLLSVVSPTPGAVVHDALVVDFRSEEELRQNPGGWGVAPRHLHLELDGAEIMPAPTDIQRLPSGAYRWVLPRPAPGEHTLRLFWSGPDHRPLAEGASEAVRFVGGGNREEVRGNREQ